MKTDEGGDKKELILKAALKLFNLEGFEKTPTARISKEAGVATGLLFHYFPSKEELIAAVYLHCKDSMIAALLAGLDPAAGIEEKLRRAFRNFLAWSQSPGGEFLFFQQFSDSSLIGERARETGRERCAPLFDLVEEGLSRGALRPARADFAFEIIASMMTSTARYLIAHPECRGDEAFIEESFRMVRDGVIGR